MSKFDWKTLVQDHLEKSKKPLFVVVGPTASGKTGFSIELATYIGNTSEVINADSRQLFRHMDIGTAKITTDEMSGVPHHLIDVLDPETEATAGWYQQEANEVIEQVHQRNGVPILVGGSMLYVSTIIDGLTLAGVVDHDVREMVTREYEKDEGATLYAKLLSIDPAAAEKIHQNNKPRLIRAMEIYETSKKTKSEAVPPVELKSGKQSSSYDLCIFGITRPREELFERIETRLTQMLEAGWIQETQNLLDKGYTKDDPGMKSHGYKEIMNYILEGEPSTQQDLESLIAKKTRGYAKRQMMWWKNDPRIHWIRQSSSSS